MNKRIFLLLLVLTLPACGTGLDRWQAGRVQVVFGNQLSISRFCARLHATDDETGKRAPYWPLGCADWYGGRFLAVPLTDSELGEAVTEQEEAITAEEICHVETRSRTGCKAKRLP